MTPEGMREAGRGILETAKQALAETGNFTPYFFLLSNQGIGVVAFDHDALNDGPSKDILFAGVRSLARANRSDAVVFLSDGWTLAFTEEQKRRLAEDPAYEAEFNRITRDEGTPAAAAAGFGQLWECILVMVQGPLQRVSFSQHYKRTTRGGPFSHFGDLVVVEGDLDGRMQFFDPPSGGVS